MPATATPTKTKAIHVVCGDDEYSIKAAATQLAATLAPKDGGPFGTEIIEGDADNQDAALKVLARLNEALQTVGLFGGGAKLVWLKSTTLLADNRTTGVEAVKDALAELAEQLKRGLPEDVTLLISAIGFDKRRTLAKTLEKIATIKLFNAPDAGKQAGEDEIREFIQGQLRAAGKTMNSEAMQAFRFLVEPDLREIANELEKARLYVGSCPAITAADVRAICSATRQAVIWDLTDAVGARAMSRAFAAMDNLMGTGEKPMGVLMMLVAQIRLTLLMRDLMQRQLITARDNDGFGFVRDFERLPTAQIAHFPLSKEGKPPSAWRLYRCALAARNFSTTELIRAMEILFQANLQLVTTQLDERLVLEEAITKIALKPRDETATVRAR